MQTFAKHFKVKKSKKSTQESLLMDYMSDFGQIFLDSNQPWVEKTVTSEQQQQQQNFCNIFKDATTMFLRALSMVLLARKEKLRLDEDNYTVSKT